jgi:alkaline phosphatase
VRGDAGVLGVAENVVRGDCTTISGKELNTTIELAEIKGMSTGIISTARITHATPAAAKEAGCEDITSQLVTFEANLDARIANSDVDGLDVVMGGGRHSFPPKDAAFNSSDALSNVEGDRTDGRDHTA